MRSIRQSEEKEGTSCCVSFAGDGYVTISVVEESKLQIPIPKVIEHGIFKESKQDKFIYSIVEKASGEFVHLAFEEIRQRVDEALIDVLYHIHSIDISETQGYGNWDEWSKAKNQSMGEHILDVIEKQKVFTNERLSNGIFEKELYERGKTKITELVEYCPSKRWLVHADYGYDNVLADKEGNITAVYDWEHSLFGDFVYDIAWLDFWEFRGKNAYSKIYREKYGSSKKLDFENYEERFLCYKLYIGMTAAGFFSESNQRDKYLEAKTKILNLLEEE